MLAKDVDTPPGQIITFYSYKGGTGRSMAVANLSCLLGRDLLRTSQRVLIMDWDIEAPGLHRYFSARCELPQFREQEGIVNYFDELVKLLQISPELYQELRGSGGRGLLEKIMPLERYITPDVVPGVDFMRAGLLDSDYARLASGFDWVSFYDRFGSVLSTFRQMLAANYAYILIDSRTGITDVSGICTALLPEKLVGVFVPNRQSLDGLCDIVRQAIDFRSKADDDFRPLSVFPLPSRIENAEKDLKDEWRATYQKAFEALFKREYQINDCDLTDYFTEVSLPHTSYYAFGEKIAVLEDKLRDAQSLSTAYARFFDRLVHLDTAWEIPDAIPQEARALATSERTRFVEPLYDAFLSYSASDEGDVARIEARLSELDVRCFLASRDLLAGEEWASAIDQAMAASRAVLVFFGRSGSHPLVDQSSLSTLESFAKQPEKRIVPVLLPGAALEAVRLPTFLRNYVAVEIRSLRDQETILHIARAVLATRPEKAAALSMRSSRRIPPAGIKAAFATLVVMASSSAAYYASLRHFKSQPSIASSPAEAISASTSTSITGVHKPSQAPTLPDWGVMVSADKTLEPASGSDGGPSAEWEPVRAWRAGYKGAVILHHGTYFVTVLPEPNQPSAEATMSRLRTSKLYKNWKGATTLELSRWCPGARYEKTLQLAEASIPVYECT